MNQGRVSVVIPTVGRVPLLRACLCSLRRCSEQPDEVLIADQSGGEEVAELVAGLRQPAARVLRGDERGAGSATNLGLREARNEIVLVTHDDCTVSDSWVRTGRELATHEPQTLWTGRVLAAGDDRAVPSTKVDAEPRDYTGELSCGALYPNNMVLNRTLALELGGFDDRVHRAEDNDFCYRWLRAGRSLRYEPSLVVWHHDWRSPAELRRLYGDYWKGQGLLYAKHLRRGDTTMLGFIWHDLVSGGRSMVSTALRRRPRWSDPRQGLLRGLVVGLVRGWRAFRREGGPRRA